jgi:hypothetical protein
MKPICTAATVLMDKLTQDVKEDAPKKLEAEPYMALTIEWIGSVELGEMYSVAHYYAQNGDLMRDPDVEFIKAKDGNYYPISYRQDGLGIDQQTVIFKEGGIIKSVYYSAQKQLATFCNEWFRNIKQQFAATLK